MATNPGLLGQQLSDAEHFQILVDALVDHAIYMLDPHGFIVSWNSGAQRLLGYSAEDVNGQHFSRFFTLEDRAKSLPADVLQAATSSGRYSGEGWLVRRNGRRFWADTVVQPIREGTGPLVGFAIISHDITERREAQQALMESERRFRLLVEGVLDYAIYMLDPSGVVVNWNAGAERMKGYTQSEIIGQHFSRFYTKEDRAAGVPARVLDIAAREERYEAEGWRVRKDGSRFWASVVVDAVRNGDGELIGFAKVTRDITERREAQEALRESERQFRLLVGAVIDYAMYMLDLNGVVISWNAGAERIKGYAADEIIGEHFSRFYTEQDRAAGKPARSLQTARDEGRFEADSWRVRKDGSLFWANVVIDAIRDEKGELIGFVKITRDITERKRTEAALQEAQVERAHAQKMEALGQLTGGVAHDFNNLLMIISGHMNALQRVAGQDAKATRAAEAITLAARRGETLTRQLLTFSRRQTLNPVVTNIDMHVEALRTMLSSTGEQVAQLTTQLMPDLWPVKVDAGEFDLALLNLTLNARDAMPQGGVITISAENANFARGAGPDDLSGDFVAIAIADTGCGIPADILPRVFDPFFTTKQLTKGTGLGLSQVHGFVHQSGGTVSIKSALGQGTSVTLYLPRATDESQDAEEPDLEALRGGSVLLVEDNPDVALATAAMLEQLQYEVVSVADADAALKAMHGRAFDLIISDIVMAGRMNGLALARVIRQQSPKQAIILVSGYSEAAAAAAREFTLLRKPYQLGELSRAAASVIAQAGREDDGNLVDLRSVRERQGRKGE